MTEQEILAQLAANDAKIVRALVEKTSMATDDTRLVEYNEAQAVLRAQLQEVRNAASS